jgi:hypothetical protein
VLGLLLVLLLVLPLLFRDAIAGRVKAAVNGTLDARVDWSGVGLGFLRDFPNLTVTLDDLTVAGVGRFERDTLAVVPHLRVSLGLGSVLRTATGGGPLEVRAVELDRPRLRLLRLADGSANWDITRDEPVDSAAPSGMEVSLRQLEIRDAHLTLDDRKVGMRAVVAGYDQALDGDFGRALVDVRTTAAADSVTVALGGVPYLDRARVALEVRGRADRAQGTYTLDDAELRLNDLTLAASGSAREAGEDVDLDLAFEAPSSDFRSLLSLVPAIYARDFDKVRTTGTLALAGRVNGRYGPAAFPAFDVTARVNDGAFQYDDLPLPARDIVLDLAATNPGGDLDSTVVRLDRFRVTIGANPVEGTLVLRTPLSDPAVDARVKGAIDLADLPRTVKLDGVEQLAGVVRADASVRTRRSWVERREFERIAASGRIDATNVSARGETIRQPVLVREASLALTPAHARLERFRGTFGSSDVEATGELENLFAYAFRNDTLRGRASVRSARFDLDEWRSGEGALEVIPVPPRLDLVVDAAMDRLSFDRLDMRDARGRLRVKDRRATLEDFRMAALGGRLGLGGWYDTQDPARPTFDVGLSMDQVDIPSAFQAFSTIQALAPVAKYAAGKMTVALRLDGALGRDLMPLFPTLDGTGTVRTSQLAIRDFPVTAKLADATGLAFLEHPTLRALAASFQIRDGRLVMKPFDVQVAGATLTVSGSNGFDQSLDYALRLRVPRAVLGDRVGGTLSSLLAKAGGTGDLATLAELPLGISLGGTVTSPRVRVDVERLASSVARGAQQAVTARASAEATQLLARAERQAAEVREKAKALADKLRTEGYERADSLTARAAGNPLKAVAAGVAARELREQADERAASIVEEASQRADSLLASARREAERLGGEPARAGQLATDAPDSAPPDAPRP